MPQNLTGVPGSFPVQRAPLPDEPRTAGSVATPYQDSANRTQYLYDRLLFLDPVKGGVRRLRRFANVAALMAATDHTDGTVCTVRGIGVYEYDASFGGAHDGVMYVKPTDVGGGIGAWVMFLASTVGAPKGIAQLDNAGKIPVSYLAFTDSANRIRSEEVRNGIISTRVIDAPGPVTVADGGALVDLTDLQMSFNLNVGDRLVVNLAVRAYIGAGDTNARITGKVVAPSFAATERLCGYYCANGSEVFPLIIPCLFAFTAVENGTHTFVAAAQCNTGADYEIQHVGGVAHAIRP